MKRRKWVLPIIAAAVGLSGLFPADLPAKKIMLPPNPVQVEQQLAIKCGLGLRSYVPPAPLVSSDPYSTEGVKEGDDCVFFSGGDRTSGRIISIAPDGSVKIANPLFEKPIEILRKSVRRIVFAKTGRIIDGPDSVVLVNGNRVRGEVTGITPEAVLVQSKALGTLSIKRSAVARVEFRSDTRYLFESNFSSGTAGPFKVRSGNWRVQGGKYHCTGGGHVSAPLAQDGPMTFEWTVSGLTSSYGGGLLLFAKDPANPTGGDAIWIRPRGTYMRVYRVRSNGRTTIMSKSMGRAFSRATFRASYDPSTGRLQLWVNGTDLGECKVNPVIKTGKHIILYSGRPVVYESVRVTAGVAILAEDTKPAKGEERFLMANRDRLSGSLLDLTAGTATIETFYGRISLPKAQLQTVVFRADGRDVAPKDKRCVTLAFHGGQTLAVRIKQMDADAIEATAALLGDVRVLRSAVRLIQFGAGGDTGVGLAGAPGVGSSVAYLGLPR